MGDFSLTAWLKKKLHIIDCHKEIEGYQELLERLKARFPYLGDGELSILLIALFCYIAKKKPYYLISDDLRFKKKISEILTSGIIAKDLLVDIKSFRISGTIGLIIQLYKKGRLSPFVSSGIHTFSISYVKLDEEIPDGPKIKHVVCPACYCDFNIDTKKPFVRSPC
jgi:hypothetical protein